MGMCTLCCCCIIILIVVLGLGGGFATWFFVTIARASDIKRVDYQVTSASLTQFDLSTTNQTLDYNLALNLTLENPSKKINWQYEGFKASASFKSQELSSVTFNSFNLGKGEKMVFPASFKGQRSVSLPVDEVSRFKNNATDFDILLSLDITHSFSVLSKKAKHSPKVECNLKVPFKSNGNSGEGFKATECKYSQK